MPKIVDHYQVRLKLAAATQRVISRLGAQGVTLRSVAKEAGVSPALPMHYFDSVEEIVIFSFITAASDELVALRTLVTKSGRDPAERMSDLIHYLLGGSAKANSERVIQLMRFMVYTHEKVGISASHAQAYESYLDLIAQLIVEHLATAPKGLSTQLANPRTEAWILLAMTDGCGLQGLSSPRNAKARVRACAEILHLRYGLTKASASKSETRSLHRSTGSTLAQDEDHNNYKGKPA
jgi:AcrR family transcriptional regulator